MTLLAIDPGVNAIGFAYWHGPQNEPNEVGVIESKLENPFQRIRWIVGALPSAYFDCLGVLAVEWPEVMTGAKGHAAAARGDVSRLAYCGGMVSQRCPYGTAIRMIPVRDWKGQLKKEVVEFRLRRLIGDQDLLGAPIESHAWDAVGIGLYYRGLRLDNKAFVKSCEPIRLKRKRWPKNDTGMDSYGETFGHGDR